MVSETKLFIDNIKPTLLITEKEYIKNIDILKDYKCKKDLKGGYLLHRKESELEGKLLGEILGYPPICAKTFEEKRKSKKPDIITNKFLNYGGIYFNCFEHYEEALDWCNKQYKEKMLSKYGKINVMYKEIEFKKNYLQGYTAHIKNIERFEILN